MRILILAVCLVFSLATANAAEPVSYSLAATVYNPLGVLPPPKLPPIKRAAPGVAAGNPFAQMCRCGDQCSCNPLDNCGCDNLQAALPTTLPTIAQSAEQPSTFKPAAVRNPARTYTVAPATERHGITSGGFGAFGMKVASGGCSSGGCANGQCGAAQTSRRGFGLFR